MKDQAEIEMIKEIISVTLKSEGIDTFQVYLFGSRARGDFSPHSDYDILIVSKKQPGIKEKIKLFTRLRRLLAAKRYNVDIIIKSNDEVNYYKNKIGHIVRSALKEGILI
jgi:predicted nucleotidyltransferase